MLKTHTQVILICTNQMNAFSYSGCWHGGITTFWDLLLHLHHTHKHSSARKTRNRTTATPPPQSAMMNILLLTTCKTLLSASNRKKKAP